eukprot:1161322-Pelagomonas_calceolata.AAC.3
MACAILNPSFLLNAHCKTTPAEQDVSRVSRQSFIFGLQLSPPTKSHSLRTWAPNMAGNT